MIHAAVLDFGGRDNVLLEIIDRNEMNVKTTLAPFHSLSGKVLVHCVQGIR